MKKLKILFVICLVITLIPIGINFYIVFQSSDKIYNQNEINKTYDIALVLGCSVLKDGSPSKMLRDRLNTSIYLYENKLAKKILISGDHSDSYSEVTTMFNYLIEHSVREEDIIIDYEGYSTGESLINYQKNYSDKSLLIVTQKYHLYRALYISKMFNLNATGVHAELVNYNGQFFREVREILARNKDFILYTFINN